MPNPMPSTSTGTTSGTRALQTRRRGPRRRPDTNFLDRKFSLRDVGRTANTALQVGKMALALVNAEKKFLFASLDPTPGTTMSITPISVMATGDTASSRDGLSVRFKGIDLRLTVHAGAALADDNQDLVRVLVVRQVISNGSAITAADLLAVSTDAVSTYNFARRAEYKILYDESFAVNAFERNKTATAYIPLDNVSTWNDVGANVSDTESGVYYVCCLAMENTATSTIHWRSQMYFYDN